MQRSVITNQFTGCNSSGTSSSRDSSNSEDSRDSTLYFGCTDMGSDILFHRWLQLKSNIGCYMIYMFNIVV